MQNGKVEQFRGCKCIERILHPASALNGTCNTSQDNITVITKSLTGSTLANNVLLVLYENRLSKA